MGVASRSYETHVTDVLEVLKLLTYEAGLRLRIEKCRFFRTEVPFLGHLLTREGIRMDPRKAKSITNWQRPVDGKAMQRFLGAVNFNREFSADFAKESAPLEACRLIMGPIEWTDERITSFNAVKEIFRKDYKGKSLFPWVRVGFFRGDNSTWHVQKFIYVWQKLNFPKRGASRF